MPFFNFLSISVEAFRKKHKLSSIGMPHFVGHGSHELNKIKHRFIVMPRFGKDIWNLFLDNGRKLPLHTIYRLAIQMVRQKMNCLPIYYELLPDSSNIYANIRENRRYVLKLSDRFSMNICVVS